MNTPTPQTTSGFAQFGIAQNLLASLTRERFLEPTPIQRQSIPVALTGKDIMGIAQTGTGKTLAFGVPMIQRLGQLGGQALVLLPTRELAMQVEETLMKVGRPLGLKTAVLIGGASMQLQLRMLRQNPHIIIATPGRMADHMEQGTVKLDKIKIAVLDEADRMLDIGFAPQIKRILSTVPKERQTMLFSATMPSEIVKLASQYLHLPLRIEVAPAGTAAATVEQEIFMVPKDMKSQLLDKLLTDYHGTVLVFTRTKHGARKVNMAVRHMGHASAEIHSNRSLAQRKDALNGFRSGKYRVLVATDIAARGIDVKGIELVINYDLPDNSEDYVHRIGRTGRAGSVGRAISFAAPDQRGEIRQIEKLIRKNLPVSALPALPPRREVVAHHHTQSHTVHSPRPHAGSAHRGGGRPWRNNSRSKM